MTIDTTSDLRIRLDMRNIQFDECEIFNVKVFTQNKDRFLKFAKDQIEHIGEHYEIFIPHYNLQALQSGVIRYNMVWDEQGYQKSKDVTTEFYLKNSNYVYVPNDTENGGLETVSKDYFEKFEQDTKEELENIQDRIDALVDEAATHTKKDENALVYYGEEENEIVPSMFIVPESDYDEVYSKAKVDDLFRLNEEWTENKIQETYDIIDESFAKKDELDEAKQELQDNIDEKADKSSLDKYTLLTDFNKQKEYVEKTFIKEHQDISNLATKDELNALTPDMSQYYTKSIADSKFLTQHQDLSHLLEATDADRLYATKEFVKDEVDKAVGVDLSDFAKVSDVDDTLLLYATKDMIPDVSKFLTQHQDISYLASKEELEEVKNEIPSLDEYASIEWIKNQKYLRRHQDLSEYAKLSDLPKNIPTRLSELINDVGYTTQYVDVNNFVTRGYLHKKYYDQEESDERYLIREQFEDKYPTWEDIREQMITKDFLEGFVTEEEFEALKEWFNNHNDEFDKYALKDEVYNKEQVNRLIDEVNVVDELSKFATKDMIPDVSGFLTQHQSLENYLTKSQGDSRYLRTHQDLSEYCKRTELSNYVRKVEMPEIPVIEALSSVELWEMV